MASLSGVKVQEEFSTLEQMKANGFTKKALLPLSLPLLELEDGSTLNSSVAIAKYLASFKSDLLGTTDFLKG
jgi:glutathione S-transferase